MKNKVGFLLGEPISSSLSINEMRHQYFIQMTYLKEEMDKIMNQKEDKF